MTQLRHVRGGIETSGAIRTTFGSTSLRWSTGSARKREDAAPRSELPGEEDGNDHPRLRNSENGRLFRVTTRCRALVAGVFSLSLSVSLTRSLSLTNRPRRKTRSTRDPRDENVAAVAGSRCWPIRVAPTNLRAWKGRFALYSAAMSDTTSLEPSRELRADAGIRRIAATRAGGVTVRPLYLRGVTMTDNYSVLPRRNCVVTESYTPCTWLVFLLFLLPGAYGGFPRRGITDIAAALTSDKNQLSGVVISSWG